MCQFQRREKDHAEIMSGHMSSSGFLTHAIADVDKKFALAEQEFADHLEALLEVIRVLKGGGLLHDVPYNEARAQLVLMRDMVQLESDEISKGAPTYVTANAATVLEQEVPGPSGAPLPRAKLLVQQCAQKYPQEALPQIHKAFSLCSADLLSSLSRKLQMRSIQCTPIDLVYLPIDRLHLYHRVCSHISTHTNSPTLSKVTARFEQLMPKLIEFSQKAYRDMLPRSVAEQMEEHEFWIQSGTWIMGDVDVDVLLTNLRVFICSKKPDDPDSAAAAAAFPVEQVLPHLLLRQLCIITATDHHELLEPSAGVDFFAWQESIHDARAADARKTSERLGRHRALRMKDTNALIAALRGESSSMTTGPRHVGLLIDAVPFMETETVLLTKTFEEVRQRLKQGGVLMQGQLQTSGTFKKSKSKWHVVHCKPCDGFDVRGFAADELRPLVINNTATHLS